MARIHGTCVGIRTMAESADFTSEQTTMHQVCWSLCDWLSPARNRIRGKEDSSSSEPCVYGCLASDAPMSSGETSASKSRDRCSLSTAGSSSRMPAQRRAVGPGAFSEAPRVPRSVRKNGSSPCAPADRL
ncbi:unnamed protein product [Pleuronectes platessa]|uniref:Uncharacterized protein n=1 Tax=Pleuronectes platessa TaxID=8262 RepID=A0A9N7ZBV9_PLEPL|nr:unnamed protein product [Pleuronectes platessa]